jgi:hypothetical protein
MSVSIVTKLPEATRVTVLTEQTVHPLPKDPEYRGMNLQQYPGATNGYLYPSTHERTQWRPSIMSLRIFTLKHFAE